MWTAVIPSTKVQSHLLTRYQRFCKWVQLQEFLRKATDRTHSWRVSLFRPARTLVGGDEALIRRLHSSAPITADSSPWQGFPSGAGAEPRAGEQTSKGSVAHNTSGTRNSDHYRAWMSALGLLTVNAQVPVWPSSKKRSCGYRCQTWTGDRRRLTRNYSASCLKFDDRLRFAGRRLSASHFLRRLIAAPAVPFLAELR
jgi:hypothetical protein